MASIRLAVYMKDMILAALIERAFKEKQDALKARWTAFADKLYHETYPPALLKKMKALPDGFLRRDDDLKFKFGGDIKRLSWGPNRPISADHQCAVVETFPATHPHTDTYRDLERDQKQLDLLEQQRRAEIQAALDSATTVGALIAKWPEVEPFARHFIREKKVTSQLPVLQTDVLNKALNLPVTPEKPAKPKKEGKLISKADLAHKRFGKKPAKKVRRA